jgi:hypothetical protein
MHEVVPPCIQASDAAPFLGQSLSAKLKTLLLDYYNFVNLALFFVLIWPVAITCHGLDRLLKTRMLDAIIRFCEAF